MVIRSQILIARSRHLDKRDKVTDINRRDWPTRLRLQQIPEFLGRDTGLAQDRPERATFEIPIMVGNGNQHARFFRMPEVVVAARMWCTEKPARSSARMIWRGRTMGGNSFLFDGDRDRL